MLFYSFTKLSIRLVTQTSSPLVSALCDEEKRNGQDDKTLNSSPSRPVVPGSGGEWWDLHECRNSEIVSLLMEASLGGSENRGMIRMRSVLSLRMTVESGLCEIS
jgi:hypothetical protein